MNERMRARAPHEVHCVTLNARLHSRARNFSAAMKNRIRIGKRTNVDLIESSRVEPVVPTRHHFELVLLTRIAQQYLELETIELRLWQWIRSFILNRVLRREHRKDRRQLVPLAVNRHLALFHRFQQCGLSFWRRAIDLVSQEDVSEDWSSPQGERRVGDVEDVRAGDVRRH